MAADGSGARNLTQEPGRGNGQWSVKWSPDGKSIAYDSYRWDPATDQMIVRWDLGAAGMLVHAFILALVALLLVALRPPFGAYALVLGAQVSFVAAVRDGWRFVPAAIIAGLIVDVVVARVRPGWRAHAAAMLLPALWVQGTATSLAVTNDLGWDPVFVLALDVAAVFLGLGVAAVARLPGLQERINPSALDPRP